MPTPTKMGTGAWECKEMKEEYICTLEDLQLAMEQGFDCNFLCISILNDKGEEV
jgi:hypothetical protein